MTVRYEAELRELHRAGVIDDATASRAIALDRGAIFSVFEELRVGLYGAVALITTGIGVLIKNNLDRIGPIAIMGTLALAAALCYASAIRARVQGTSRSLGGDYILLLGALILSADVAYAESQFHWLDANWSWHLLILAVVHGVTAYLLDSRLVLSVALASLAGWFGVEHYTASGWLLQGQSQGLGWRALLCAIVVLGARFVHERMAARRQFEDVFEHFAANLAFWGALIWCSDERMRFIGILFVTVFAMASVFKGLRARQEVFVVYGVGYAAIGYAIVANELIGDLLANSVALLLITTVAAAALWRLHGHIKEVDE